MAVRVSLSYFFVTSELLLSAPTRYAIFFLIKLYGFSLPGAWPEADPAYVPKIGIHTTSPFWD
jgi:hypothetical protein